MAGITVSECPLQKQQTQMATLFQVWPPASCPEPNKETGQFQAQPLLASTLPIPEPTLSVLLCSLSHIPSELEVNKLITDEWETRLQRF